MPKREYVQLAQAYNPLKSDPSRMLLSEKYDGLRAIWDGGVSRGVLATEVPYANTAKDARFLTAPTASGLWSRLGKVIHAPAEFLDQLPLGLVLDGELTLGRGTFQKMTDARSIRPSYADWKDVCLMVLDCPAPATWLANGLVERKPHLSLVLRDCVRWFQSRGGLLRPPTPFQMNLDYLHKTLQLSRHVQIAGQEKLPSDRDAARDFVESKLGDIVADGGEGIVLRQQYHMWEPNRTKALLKYKPYLDDEGTVVGYVWGRETELGSKLLGMMGALIVEWRGLRFKLSGFTEAERKMEFCAGVTEALDWGSHVERYGARHAGEEVASFCRNPLFPLGCKVTFKYRELTVDKYPKEARYFRKRNTNE